jgi:S-adenosylmethionine decarboxylase
VTSGKLPYTVARNDSLSKLEPPVGGSSVRPKWDNIITPLTANNPPNNWDPELPNFREESSPRTEQLENTTNNKSTTDVYNGSNASVGADAPTEASPLHTGKHVILDCYDFVINDINELETVLINSAKESGATVLGSNFHPFTDISPVLSPLPIPTTPKASSEALGVTPHGIAITGVILLAESHISIHTWPEYRYAAVDIFMCGNCCPEKAAEYFLTTLNITDYKINIIYRGNIKYALLYTTAPSEQERL